MGHKFLIALDESDISTKIANYLKTLLKEDDEVTLYSVLPNPAVLYDFDDASASPLFIENRSFFSTLEKSKKETMNKIFGKVKKIISDSGLGKDKIDAKLEMQNGTIARHIVDEAERGKYNTIVIGKHNSSRLTEILLGDVTHKVIHLAKDIPIIVV